MTLSPTSVRAQDSDTLVVTTASDARSLIASAEAALLAGDAAGAYAQLSARESDFAGNAYFDYLLGIAALDSGRNSEAVFSLHRAIAVEPQFAGARMELARAYYESGNYAQARPLFATLLNENPPVDVRNVLHDYIAAIDTRPAAAVGQLRSFAEFGMGYDTNANGSTDNQQFLGFTLSPANVETESGFVELAAGFSYSKPRSSQFAWYAGGRAGYRNNPDASFVDSGVISGNGGFSWRRDRFFGRLGLDGYWASRDGRSNQGWAGLDVLFGSQLSSSWDLSFGIRGGALRYRESIEVLDVNRLLGNIGLTYRPSPQSAITLELIGGNDNERVASSPYGNSKSGARLSFSTPLADGFATGAIGTLESDFDGLFFGVPRKDQQLNAHLQLEFRDIWIDGLALIPRLRYTDNDSDVALYEYDRIEIGVLLRWTPQ